MGSARRNGGAAGAAAARATRRGVLGGLVGTVSWTLLPQRGVAQCEPVELYPGYPGYRGYVTGLDGVGDHACLADLEAADPGFDRAAEDRANLDAARDLGLAGSPDDWTWENWMAIEAERGLPPTCYACAMADAARRPAPRGAAADPDDPRLLIGGFGTTVALDRFAGGDPAAVRQFVPYDHLARALLGMMSPGHWNAPQMLAGYEDLVGFLLTTSVGGLPSFGQLYENLLAQGGYAPTPAAVTTEDQVYLVSVGIEAAGAFLPELMRDLYLQRYYPGLITAWQAGRAEGSEGTLAEYLREHGA